MQVMNHATLPPVFKRLAGANLAAQAAEQVSLAAVPIVAVLMLGAGPGEVGLLATAQTLPFLLLSIPAGLLADRVSKRRLMVWAEALRVLAFVGLLLAVIAGQLSLTLLAVLGFVGAMGTVGFSVAAPALVPALVPRSALAAANGRLELARSIAFAAGPALAGALVSWAGATPAFVLAAVLSVAALVLLLGLPDAAAASVAPRRHPLVELREGATQVWRSSLLRPILLTAVVWNVSWFVLQAAYVPHAVHTLGLDARGVGFTLASYGVGMVAGALAAPLLLQRLNFGHAVLLGPLVSVLAALLMVATLHAHSGVLAAVAFFCFGAGPIVWTISSTTLRQAVTPGLMLGRVTAMFLAVNMGARPLGAALGGWVGEHFGTAACLWLALLGFGLQALLIVASAVRELRQLPAAA
jgi:predicted MFS family arabinose efflux permease